MLTVKQCHKTGPQGQVLNKHLDVWHVFIIYAKWWASGFMFQLWQDLPWRQNDRNADKQVISPCFHSLWIFECNVKSVLILVNYFGSYAFILSQTNRWRYLFFNSFFFWGGGHWAWISFSKVVIWIQWSAISPGAWWSPSRVIASSLCPSFWLYFLAWSKVWGTQRCFWTPFLHSSK